MAAFILVRLLQAIPALIGVTAVAFVLLLSTGDLTQVLLPMQATDEVRAAYREAYGLDRPIPVQYAHYLSRLVQGDFGRSFAFNRQQWRWCSSAFPPPWSSRSARCSSRC